MKNIEVELRSFITEQKSKELLNFFKVNGQFIDEDYQETFYFDSAEDLRIQKNENYSKIWMKKGKMHDEAREEIEIKVEKDDFGKLENLFLGLGYNVEIKWFRTRNTFKWQEIDVCIDYTKGYGYIIELEILSNSDEKEKNLDYLKSKFLELEIEISPKEEFTQKYEFYKNNWYELTKND